MGKIGVGFLGAGSRARGHASIFKAIPEAELVAVCDVVKRRAEKMAKDFGMPYSYTDYEEMLKNERVDAVVVATPGRLHGQQSLRCLEAGEHVLSEIPLGYTYEECRSLVRAVERTGLKLFFGQEARYWNLYATVKRLTEDGEFGDIFYAETEYLHSAEYPYNYYEHTPWRIEASMMIEGGPHPVDILRWVVGSELVEVQAYTSRKARLEDFTIALYKAENGCVGRVFGARNIIRPYSLSLRLYGTKATFEQDSLPWALSGKICKVPPVAPEPPMDWRGGFDVRPLKLPPEPQVPVTVHGSCDYLQAKDFVRSILEDSSPAIDVYEGAKTSAACIAAVEAAEKERKVRIPSF